MSEPTPSRPKKRIRFGRILLVFVLLGLLGAGLYGASWLNARRYFLIVGLKEVRIGKGRMLPIGHRPFVPRDPSLRGAYRSFPIPSGMKEARGETTFDDRVQLDQALFRLLRAATEYALTTENAEAQINVARYLEQLRAIPGINAEQQGDLMKLEKDASYVEASGHLTKAQALMEKAKGLFEKSATGGGGRFSDGRDRASTIEAALVVLKTDGKYVPVPAPPRPAAPPPKAPVATSTQAAAATSTAAR